MAGLTRRGTLAGLAAGLATGAWAKAPQTSPRPVLRGVKAAIDGDAATDKLIAAANLGGQVSYVLADMTTGKVLAARLPHLPMPPASTAKVITSLYALAHLGADHRFETRLLANGPVSAGQLQGDLMLVGGGDPTLTTDTLGDFTSDIARLGVKSVAGRFQVWAGALPYIAEIDRDQPDWVGYNPAVAGLNLNFNRVNFTWQRGSDGYELGFDARAERFAPAVFMAKMQVVDREAPLFTYEQHGATENWTVAKAALGTAGSRWLPVRRPDIYAGDVFQSLSRATGLDLSKPEILDRLPEARLLARHDSENLWIILREMMKYSTNMTAEAVGMATSLRLGIANHAASAQQMTSWLSGKIGRSDARFVDHSGLGGRSRISAADMVEAVIQLGADAGLSGLMKEVKLKTEVTSVAGKGRVLAKTGTLNFVSALVGYLTTATGEERAFAIFSGDPDRRDAVPEAQKESPQGLSGWLKRSRRLQQQLLGSWAA